MPALKYQVPGVRRGDAALSRLGRPGAGGGPAGGVTGLGAGVRERDLDAATPDVSVADLDQRGGVVSAHGPDADGQNVDAVAVDDRRVIGAVDDGDAPPASALAAARR